MTQNTSKETVALTKTDRLNSSGHEVGTSFNALYERALPSKRTGPLYGAFPYPTKISPESIALYIASHTNPGDLVFDGFAGSGMTGLAALLCENPSKEMLSEANRLNLPVEWGARNAVLYELGALGSFVGKTLTSPPDPGDFHKAAENLLLSAEEELGWMYEAYDPAGNKGMIRHAVLSDLLRCPACSSQVTLWDSCVELNPAKINSVFHCPQCSHNGPFDEAERLTETVEDDVTGSATERRKRSAARVYGVTGKTRWSRAPIASDIELLDRVEQYPLPDSIPNVLIPWGDLYRKGYHKGITHLHHFYTRRNLIVFARLYELADEYDESVRDALRFWLLSYNAAHATLMTRVVAKSRQKDLVVTSAQPGVLYISGLPVEKNLFVGLKRKLKTISDAFSVIRGLSGTVEVNQKSSCAIDMPDSSIDYVFTDPPFGGNIPYAEISFINEAWLGYYTNRTDEIIVSESQKKTIKDYENLLTKALSELHRTLKPEGRMTLVFHSASAGVWNALQDAFTKAGFNVECAGVLDKQQGSFKQVTTTGSVRGDPVLLLNRTPSSQNSESRSVWTVAEELRKAAFELDLSEQTPQRLYSRLVSHFLTNHQKVPLDADDFYRWHNAQSKERGTDSEKES